MIRYNEHGGLVIRQSDLSSYTRCPQQKKISDDLQAQGIREQTLSATVYGTVVHHALQVFEEHRHLGRADALEVALATFTHYWEPENIGDLEPGGIDVWLPRQTYGGLRARGIKVITEYAAMIEQDNGQLLALEYQFAVPLVIDGRQHTLTGTVDRMSRRMTTSGKRRPFLNLEDFKTGKVPTYLRHKMQFTAYAWASLQRPFWDGFDDPEDAWAKTHDWARRTTWVDMQTVTRKDGGWRGPQDYARLMVALREYIRAVEADVYPLNLEGAVCTYCPFSRTGQCGGVPVADDDEGKPA
jgi:hypothetical protein